jgi:hypothetical protein
MTLRLRDLNQCYKLFCASEFWLIIAIQIVLMADCRISRVFTTGIVSTVIISMRETGQYIHELDMK